MEWMGLEWMGGMESAEFKEKHTIRPFPRYIYFRIYAKLVDMV